MKADRFPTIRLNRRQMLRTLLITAAVPLAAACAAAPSQPVPQPTAPAAPAPTQPPAAAAPTRPPAAPAPTTAPAPTQQPAQTARPAEPKVLRLAWNAPPPNFNPLTAVSRAQQWFFFSTMSMLTQIDTVKQQFVPDLAESWTISPDGMSYTFNLRKNAKWHDGTPVTAKDVYFTYKAALTPDTQTKLAGRLSLIRGAADYTAGKSNEIPGMTIVDQHTIKFDMEFPNSLFLFETATGASTLALLPEHILGNVPPVDLPKQAFFSTAPVGSGPFKLVRYAPDQFVEVEANPDYYFGKPKIDRIIFNIIKSPDTIEVAKGRGEIEMPVFDGGTATMAMFQKFVADQRFQLVGTQGTSVVGYGFNFRHDYLKNPLIHQAVLHAVDRHRLVERFNGGNGTIYNSHMTHEWYQKPEWANLYPYDPDRARALLREAGWDSSRTVDVNVITLANEDIRAMVAAEQQMMASVGFNINFREMELPVWVEKFYDTHDFEMVRVTFGVFPDPDGFLNFHLKTGSKNAFGYANPELDAKIERGRRTIDRAERTKIYQEINEEMLRVLPVAPMYMENTWWIKARKWHVPIFANLPVATGLKDVPIMKIMGNTQDPWKFHQEEWELR